MSYATFSKLGSEEYGRLGNQLFEVASTIGIAIKNKLDYVFPPWFYNKFWKNPVPTFQSHFYRTMNWLTWRQCIFGHEEVELCDKYNWDIEGYLQSPQYFQHCELTIRNHFNPSPKLCNNVYEIYRRKTKSYDRYKLSCAVHVRRSDYEQTPWMVVQPISYYLDAIKYIKENTDTELFWVFCHPDDRAWCYQHLLIDGKYFIMPEANRDIIDLLLMSSCTYKIIANSTFSWWAAWLRMNGCDNLVVAPKEWYHPQHNNWIARANNGKDILVPEWRYL
jgi:hypothetical protein